MRHGLSFLPDADEDGIPAADYYDMVLDLSVLADDAGLTHVKMTEHYLRPYGGYCPSPLTFLAAVAARTTRIRLMTGCPLARLPPPAPARFMDEHGRCCEPRPFGRWLREGVHAIRI